jgi:PKD repeat protein
MKRLWASLSLLLVVATLLPALAFAKMPVEEAASAPIDPYILEEMAASPDGTAAFFVLFEAKADLSPAYAIDDWELRGQFVYQTLKATAERSQASLRAWLDARGIGYRSFIIDNSVFLTAGQAVLDDLAAFPGVAKLRGNHVYTITPSWQEAGPAAKPDAIAWGVSHIGADQVWNDYGFKGQGIVVAGMTTGVEYTHDALFVNYKCQADPGSNECWEDPSNICGGLPCDNNGQGTHTMGTMVGDDDPGLAWNAGVAPDAQWIYCKGCESSSCSEFALNACADWLLAPNTDPANRPHVIGAAWGWNGDCNDFYQAKVQAWRAAGIFPAFSPGAGGPGCSTMRSPGDYPESFATGATDDTDTIASFSSRGPSCTTFGSEIKPEVAAPGVNIPSSVPPNTWAIFSGTSMSAMHTAGTAALILSAAPGFIGDVEAVELIMTSTAACIEDLSCGGTPCPDGRNNVYGWGRIDAYAAVSMALQGFWIPGPPDPFDLTRYDCVWYDNGMGSYYYNQRVYCMGGRVGASAEDGSIWRFNPTSGSWLDTFSDVYESVSNYTANVLRDENGVGIYMVGGYDGETLSYVDHVQRWYPPTGPSELVSTDPWPGVVGSTTTVPGGCTVVQNKIYCFGGWESTEAPYVSAETWEYDPTRLAGARWQQITTADLNMPRGYIQVAVQDDIIYAMGGVFQYIPSPTDLVPTSSVEALDVNNLAAGWQILADMPVPSGEGRGFGMDVDTVKEIAQPPWDGTVYVVGGGDWPDQTAEAMSYDITSDTWDQLFADLNDARRDHAGAFVPYYTADPNDGLPAMWVFGGRVYGDDPPFGEPEYYPFGACDPAAIMDVHTEVDLCEVHFTPELAGSPPFTYDWDFGFTSSSHADPFIAFPGAGTYPYTLTVTNCDDAYSDSYQSTVVVSQCPTSCAPYGTRGIIPDMPGLIRARWSTTDFQVINLDPDTQSFSARFVDPNGEEIYSFDDTLPGGGSRFYSLTDSLPPDFEGTLILDSPLVAAGVVHLEDPPEQGGNTIFAGVDEIWLGKNGYTPIDPCTELHVHNLSEATDAVLDVHVFDVSGAPAGTLQFSIPPEGLLTVNPVEELGLPPDFVGSAALNADQAIEVTVQSGCTGQGYASYVAPAYCGTTNLIPYIPPRLPGMVSTTITIQNPTPYVGSATISYSLGFSTFVYLDPWEMRSVDAPFTEPGGYATVDSEMPVVVVVQSVSADPLNPGIQSYRGYAPEETDTAASLPVLFSGYAGWETGDHLWVMNAGSTTAAVRIRYISVPDGSTAWDGATIPPGEVWQGMLPELPGQRGAAILVADQPILAVAGGMNEASGEYRDRQILYAGVNFPFAHELVHTASFSFLVNGWNASFNGDAQGTSPITYLWDFGDGYTGSGQTAFHTYGAEGTYTVIMTATNLYGYGTASTSDAVTIVAPTSYQIYLPVVLRNYTSYGD